MNILKLTFPELVGELERRYGKGAYHAAALYRAIFRDGNPDLGAVEAFKRSPKLLEKLKQDLVAHPVRVSRIDNDADLIKFTTRLHDGFDVESVIIPMAGRFTVCISSQAGCRMGCTFCETGRRGFHRNLEVDEIVGQVYAARFILGVGIRNVVFMGMGEPLDNVNPVLQAVRILSDPRGMNIANRHITISTVGLADAIRDLSKENAPTFRLAVSLNAPNNRIRSQIMPINQKYPMHTLKAALMDYPLKRNEVIFIEYVLIKNVNDTQEHARELSEFLHPLNAKVNIIPLNPTKTSPFSAPSESDTDRFCERLRNKGLVVSKRARKGQAVMAACGQLGGIRDCSLSVSRLK